MSTVQTTTEMRCSNCDAEPRKQRLSKHGQPILPRFWQSWAGQVFCQKCWHEHWHIRTIHVPIAKPLNGTWQELRTSLKGQFRLSTQLHQWTANELYKADVRREGGRTDQKTMPAFVAPYLYPAARLRFPQIPTGTLVEVQSRVQRKWLRTRYNVLWTSSASPPHYRYPAELPFKSKAWRVELFPLENQQPWPILVMRLGEKRWQLWPRGGHGFRGQIARLRAIANGEYPVKTLTLSEKRRGKNQNRPGVGTGTNGGGSLQFNELMASVVVWLPNRERQNGDESAALVTGHGRLFTMTLASGRQFNYHCREGVRWVYEHQRKVQTVADDRKFERRVPRRRGLDLQAFLDAASRKQWNRLLDRLHKISHYVVKFALRNKLSRIDYGDSDRSYVDWPWTIMRQMIEQKLHAAGVQFIHVNAKKEPSNQDNSLNENKLDES